MIDKKLIAAHTAAARKSKILYAQWQRAKAAQNWSDAAALEKAWHDASILCAAASWTCQEAPQLR